MAWDRTIEGNAVRLKLIAEIPLSPPLRKGDFPAYGLLDDGQFGLVGWRMLPAHGMQVHPSHGFPGCAAGSEFHALWPAAENRITDRWDVLVNNVASIEKIHKYCVSFLRPTA